MVNPHVFRLPPNLKHIHTPQPQTKTPPTHGSGEFSSSRQRVTTYSKNVLRFLQTRLSFCGFNFNIAENSHSTAHSAHTFTC